MKYMFFSLLLIMGLLLIACGEDERQEEVDEEIGYTYTIQTLTVVAPYFFEHRIRDTWNSLRRTRGAEFQLELTTFDGEEELNNLITRMQVMAMTGEGYDLMYMRGHPFNNFIFSDFLMDIYELIDNSPTVNRDDFFTNVLEAFEYNGQLLTLPLSFGFQYVGINANLPQYYIDRFTRNPTISMSELMQIYSDLHHDYFEEFGHLGIGSSEFVSKEWIINKTTHFIDVDQNTVDLTNSQFVDFLEKVNQVFEFPAPAQSSLFSEFLSPSQYFLYKSDNYVFSLQRQSLNPINALFTFEHPYFVHYIPLSDDYGNLIVFNALSPHDFTSTWGQVSVHMNANPQLAWEFIEYSMEWIYLGPSGLTSLTTPTSRILANEHSERAAQFRNLPVYDRVNSWWLAADFAISIGGQPAVGGRNEDGQQQQIDNALSRLEVYNEMPIMPVSFIDPAIYEAVFDDFFTLV